MLRALIVALTTLEALFEPNDFVKISLIPASSTTGRVAPPAITPVPSLAGFKIIRLALNLTSTS